MNTYKCPKHEDECEHGYECFDDNGNLIAWFKDFGDAVLWLAAREKRKSAADGLPKNYNPGERQERG